MSIDEFLDILYNTNNLNITSDILYLRPRLFNIVQEYLIYNSGISTRSICSLLGVSCIECRFHKSILNTSCYHDFIFKIIK